MCKYNFRKNSNLQTNAQQLCNDAEPTGSRNAVFCIAKYGLLQFKRPSFHCSLTAFCHRNSRCSRPKSRKPFLKRAHIATFRPPKQLPAQHRHMAGLRSFTVFFQQIRTYTLPCFQRPGLHSAMPQHRHRCGKTATVTAQKRQASLRQAHYYCKQILHNAGQN